MPGRGSTREASVRSSDDDRNSLGSQVQRCLDLRPCPYLGLRPLPWSLGPQQPAVGDVAGEEAGRAQEAGFLGEATDLLL